MKRCFLIGVPRAATTSLATALASHQQVYLSDPKEPHFAAFGTEGARCCGPGDDHTINAECVRDPRIWLHSPASASVWLDASTTTLSYSQGAVETIASHIDDDPYFVLVTRKGADRALSAYRYLRARGFETLGFKAALGQENSRRAAGYQHLWWYQSAGLYGDLLRPIVASFGTDRLLVLPFEELVKPNTAAIGQCFEFLGLEPQSDVAMPAENGALGTSPLSKAITWFAYGTKPGSALRRHSSSGAITLARKLASGGRQDSVSIDPELARVFAVSDQDQQRVLAELLAGEPQP